MSPTREGRQQFSEDSQASSGLSARNEAQMASRILRDSQGSDIVLSTEEQLSRMLSLGTEISTTSSFANRVQEALGKRAVYRAIGAGTCGKVFELAGTTTVFKLANTVDDSGLWNDYKMHARVAEAFSNAPSIHGLRIPNIYYYITASDEEWWAEQKDDFPEEYGIEPRSVLCTERILPLPKQTRDNLINAFCPENIKDAARAAPANKDCLARVYLGKREEKRIKPLSVFSLRNFNLNLDRIERVGMQDTENIANLMGRGLAIMHWKAGIDADDVEFVLGSTPTYPIKSLSYHEIASLPDTPQSTGRGETNNPANFKRRATQLWLLDFNKCKDITRDEAGVKQAIRSFFRNDPYFPRPCAEADTAGAKLWEQFVEGYLDTSNTVLQGENDDEIKDLPQHFIRECVVEQEAEKRLAQMELE